VSDIGDDAAGTVVALSEATGDEPAPPTMGDAIGETSPSGRWGRRRGVVLAVVAVAVCLLGVAAVVLLARGDGHPDAWDSRIQDLVDFVEDERNLEFEHPVRVEFVSEDEWADRAEQAADDLTAEDRQRLEHGAATYRALGLAEGDFDLLDSFLNLTTDGAVGRYEFDEQRISVRGTELGPEARATLVHELTHALQDQHFDVGDRFDEMDDSDDASQLRALVEGDAERIEAAWIDSLSDEDARELEEAEAETGETAEDELSDVPASLIAFFAADYVLGPRFVDAVLADGGRDALDDAFSQPPGPEEHVLDPLSYLSDDDPAHVEPPVARDGEEVIEGFGGDFGALGLYLMLAERTEPLAALEAVDGWDGDAFVVYESNDRTCVRAAVLADDARAARRLESALLEWQDAMPEEALAEVSEDDNVLTIQTCDPGTDADVVAGEGRSSEVIAVPAVRADIAIGILENGATVEQARCFSRGLLTFLTFDELTSDNTSPARMKEVEAFAADLADQCLNGR
jgi:hypothetical protein